MQGYAAIISPPFPVIVIKTNTDNIFLLQSLEYLKHWVMGQYRLFNFEESTGPGGKKYTTSCLQTSFYWSAMDPKELRAYNTIAQVVARFVELLP